MNIKQLKQLIFLPVVLVGVYAQAGLLHFEGYLEDFNDILITEFVVENDQDVSIWTDSYQNGANIDPIGSLWASDGSYISVNDDNADVDPVTQTDFDTGMQSYLTAGKYYFALSIFDNFPDINGNILGESPFPVDSTGHTSGDGLYYSLWFDGVASADVISSVSAPGSLALFAMGLAGLLFSRKKRSV